MFPFYFKFCVNNIRLKSSFIWKADNKYTVIICITWRSSVDLPAFLRPSHLQSVILITKAFRIILTPRLCCKKTAILNTKTQNERSQKLFNAVLLFCSQYESQPDLARVNDPDMFSEVFKARTDLIRQSKKNPVSKRLLVVLFSSILYLSSKATWFLLRIFR